MNEQIRELWEQAKTSGVHPKFGEYDKYSAEKFAQLIVRECVQYLNTEIDRLNQYQNSLPEYSNHSKREDVDLVIEKCLDNIQGIKQHFGVE